MRLVLPLVLCAAFVSTLPALASPTDKADLRASIGKSMAILDNAQVKFDKQATCASCHNQIQPMVAAVAARDKGLPVNAATYQRQVDMAAEVIRSRRNVSLTHGVANGAHAVVAPVLIGLAEARYPADESTDAAVIFLLSKQGANGSWPQVAVRSPHGESPFDMTSNSVRAIDLYAPPGLREQADASMAKARAWLIATPAPAENDAQIHRLDGLVWTKAPAAEIAKARQQLIAGQQADGGWAQKPGMACDAYATAGTLLALHHAGMKASDLVYQKGLAYLLKTQAADGSWHVKAHALPIQPPIDAGFPYGPDQWISAWATGYAAEAMAYAL